MFNGPNYGRHVLLNPSFTLTGGMAAPSANTRGGVFGPQGYGGGIFDGMSGMGSPVGLGASDAELHPWLEETEATRTLQGDANSELVVRGLPQIATDGVLGPITCGAVQVLSQPNDSNQGNPAFSVPTTCQSYNYPPAPTATPRTGPPGDGPESQSSIGGGGNRTLMFLGIAGVVAALGIVMARKKRRR
jgi:hypothetical protein